MERSGDDGDQHRKFLRNCRAERISRAKLGEAQKLLKEKQIDFQELDAFKVALLQGIGSGVAITDSEGRINYFNQQAQSLTSLNEAAVMGKPFDQIFPGLKFDFHRNDRLSAVFNQELPLPVCKDCKNKCV
jgi:PAS domain-containing protein